MLLCFYLIFIVVMLSSLHVCWTRSQDKALSTKWHFVMSAFVLAYLGVGDLVRMFSQSV